MHDKNSTIYILHSSTLHPLLSTLSSTALPHTRQCSSVGTYVAYARTHARTHTLPPTSESVCSLCHSSTEAKAYSVVQIIAQPALYDGPWKPLPSDCSRADQWREERWGEEYVVASANKCKSQPVQWMKFFPCDFWIIALFICDI